MSPIIFLYHSGIIRFFANSSRSLPLFLLLVLCCLHALNGFNRHWLGTHTKSLLAEGISISSEQLPHSPLPLQTKMSPEMLFLGDPEECRRREKLTRISFLIQEQKFPVGSNPMGIFICVVYIIYVYNIVVMLVC